MIYALVILLFLIVLLFGLSAGMDSYATAKQAEAVIEVARIGQINAFVNLAVILFCVALAAGSIALLFWLVTRRQTNPRKQQSAQPDMTTLVQLATLKMLAGMGSGAQAPRLSAPVETPVDIELWDESPVWVER